MECNFSFSKKFKIFVKLYNDPTGNAWLEEKQRSPFPRASKKIT